MEALAVLGDDVPEPLAGELAGLEDQASAAARGGARRGSRAIDGRRRVARLAPRRRRREGRGEPGADAPAARDGGDALRRAGRDLFGTTAWRLARLWRGAGETDRALAAALDAASAAEVAKD